MFCENYADWGILYLYDELAPDAKNAFKVHLSTCQKCQSELMRLKESKHLVQSLPLEEIAPISFKEIVPLAKPAPNIFEKYIQPFWNSIYSVFQYRRRWLLVPVAVSFLLLMMFYLFNPGFKIFQSSVSPDTEMAFEWDVGLMESLDSLDQKITQLKSENLVREAEPLAQTGYFSGDHFSDQHFNQIAADIQSLSSELNHLNF